VRDALVSESPLRALVEGGLGAVADDHRKYIDEPLRPAIADSLDLDEAMRPEHGSANRWDYLLGHAPSSAVIGLEPHSAKQDEISTVIAKHTAAKDQLRQHLRDGARVDAWFWVASKKVHFADTEKARRRLDQHGIEFVGTRVLAKHLAKLRKGGG
jgi:hypothetical protein